MDGNDANGILNIFNGWEAIKNNRCDVALVSTANVQSLIEVTTQINDFKKLSPDGKCKSYDDSGKSLFISEFSK